MIALNGTDITLFYCIATWKMRSYWAKGAKVCRKKKVAHTTKEKIRLQCLKVSISIFVQMFSIGK